MESPGSEHTVRSGARFSAVLTIIPMRSHNAFDPA